MMYPVAHVLATAAVLMILPHLVPGIEVESPYAALIVALLWGLLGLTIRPVLWVLTLPINILTFGLFSFILNALLFWFLATFVDGFAVAGFLPALIGSVALAGVAWVLHQAL